MEAVDRLCQFAGTPEFASVPARISEQGRASQQPILQSGHFIVEGSCSMIHSAKSLAVNPKDPPTWQSLANSSKSVSDAIKKLVSRLVPYKLYLPKGQLISECLFDLLNFPKKTLKNLTNFCPEI